jgi:hypothetical protein
VAWKAETLADAPGLTFIIHPPSRSHSLHKYAPLDWSAYFDEERRVAIPDTEDVRCACASWE